MQFVFPYKLDEFFDNSLFLESHRSMFKEHRLAFSVTKWQFNDHGNGIKIARIKRTMVLVNSNGSRLRVIVKSNTLDKKKERT